MLSAIFFMSEKGEIIISRVYRDDVNRTMASAFKNYILDTKEIRSPIKVMGGTSYLHIREGNMFIVAICRANINAGLVFELLHKLVETFRSYFKTVDQTSLRQNFVLVYELLDEILDFGYPQHCTKEVLQAIITQGKARYDAAKGANGAKIAKQVTGAVPWRKPNLSYKKNQIFIDVIETVNVLVSSKNNILSADATGNLLLKSELSGMPTCTVGLNDRAVTLARDGQKAGGKTSHRGAGGIAVDSFTFHQCVSLDKFDLEHKISFCPPDGQFDLMKYRTSESIKLPFRLHHNIQESGDKIDIHITVKSAFSHETFASNFKLKIPVPQNTAVCKATTQTGRARYLPESNCLLWKITRFNGQSESTIHATVELIHTVQKSVWSRPPISMDFEVPMFTASGFQIKYMKVVETKEHYQAIKWVRYLTRAGSYQFRF